MANRSKEYMLNRLSEIGTALQDLHEVFLSVVDSIEEYDEPEAVTPESDERESLPDDTPVGHGWVVSHGIEGPIVHRLESNGLFTRWIGAYHRWGALGNWHKKDLIQAIPATVGDLRRVNLFLSEWPEITAPEVEPSRAEKAEAELRARELHHFEAEQSEAKAIAERDNAIAALRFIRRELAALAAGYVHEDDDARSAYRQSLVVVEGQARRRGIDLGEEVS